MRHLKAVSVRRATHCADQFSLLGIVIGYLQEPLSCKKELDQANFFTDKPGDDF